MRTRRKDKDKTLRKRILILCEGAKTEPNYFNGIKHDARMRHRLAAVDIEIYQPNSYSPLGLAREALAKKKNAHNRRNPYDQIWVVFDRDFHKHIEEVFKMCYKHHIHIAYSNICFELWFLLHYQRIDRPFSKCDNIIQYIRHHHDNQYHKNSKHFQHLKSKTPTAIANARWLAEQQEHTHYSQAPLYERNPYTNVHELVEYLLEL